MPESKLCLGAPADLHESGLQSSVDDMLSIDATSVERPLRRVCELPL